MPAEATRSRHWCLEFEANKSSPQTIEPTDSPPRLALAWVGYRGCGGRIAVSGCRRVKVPQGTFKTVSTASCRARCSKKSPAMGVCGLLRIGLLRRCEMGHLRFEEAEVTAAAARNLGKRNAKMQLHPLIRRVTDHGNFEAPGVSPELENLNTNCLQLSQGVGHRYACNKPTLPS
jgi:hypothetical protein